jgi:hypothetical protein
LLELAIGDHVGSPLPLPPPDKPSAAITTSPATISQIGDEKSGLRTATQQPPVRLAECGPRKGWQQPGEPVIDTQPMSPLRGRGTGASLALF